MPLSVLDETSEDDGVLKMRKDVGKITARESKAVIISTLTPFRPKLQDIRIIT